MSSGYIELADEGGVGAVYRVPLVTADLPPAETLLQISDVLRHLQRVTDHVFARVEARAVRSADRLARMQTRVKSVADKVQRLAESDRPIQLVCSSQYPVVDPDPLAGFPRIFSLSTVEDAPRIEWTPVPELPSDLMPSQSRTDVLELFHVRQSGEADDADISSYVPRTVPSYLQSPASLLVFDSMEHAYAQEEDESGPFDLQRSTPTSELTETDTGLAAAPLSLIQGAEQSADDQVDDFWYRPGSAVLPELSAPLLLPDLPGGCSGNLSLPPDIPSAAKNRQPFPGVTSLSVTSPPRPPLTSSQPAAAGGLAKEGIGVGLMRQDSERLGAGEVKTGVLPSVEVPPVPPPPPPPPPPLPPPMTPAVDVAAGGDDLRSTLMDAIRRAGGKDKAKLRTATDQQDTDKEKALVGSGGGDLMSDLAAKLSLRRKGISGNVRAAGTDSAGVLDRMSSLIPPPPASEVPAARTTAPNDNDNDDDWD